MKIFKYSQNEILEIKSIMDNAKIIYRDTGKNLVISYKGDDVSGAKPPKYFTDFATEVRTFMKEQLAFNKAQLAFNEKIWNKVEAIANCPTIKRELAESKEG